MYSKYNLPDTFCNNYLLQIMSGIKSYCRSEL